MVDETLDFQNPDTFTEQNMLPEDFDAVDFNVTEQGAVKAMQTIPGEIAKWTMAHANASILHSARKVRLARMRSEKYTSYRELMEAAGKKPTEKTLDAKLDTDVELTAQQALLLEAEWSVKSASAIIAALKVKADMLTALNNRRNAEVRSQVGT